MALNRISESQECGRAGTREWLRFVTSWGKESGGSDLSGLVLADRMVRPALVRAAALVELGEVASQGGDRPR